MNRPIIVLSVVLCVLCGVQAKVQGQTQAQGYTVADEGAWCWFADPRALHYENVAQTINATYIGYIDVHGNIKATQHDFLTGTTNEVLIRSYFQPDDHDNPTFLVLPDERVMIFYSRHTDEACFYYRISTRKGNITSLGEEHRLATANNTTYPSPFILSNDPNHIYLCWRGINWHPTIGRLTMPDQNDNASFDWGPKQIVQSTGARPYAKYMSNSVDKIYLTYTTGHPDNEYPNWLYFNYINIPSSDASQITLTDVKGTVLSTVNNGVHNVNKSNYNTSYPYAVVDNQADARNWVWQVAADEAGKPVIAMVRINNGKTSHDYYHATWTGTEWKKTFLANGGGHFHQTAGLEMCYSGGMAIDESDPASIYCSVPVNGKYEIVKYSITTNGNVTSQAITTNSAKGNARPYFIHKAAASPLNLVWMQGDYYDWIVSSTRPQGYPTGIKSNYNLYPTPVTSVPNARTIEEGQTATVDGSEFSISLFLSIDKSNYGGDILQIGDLTYGLNGTTLKPYVKKGSTATFNSQNLLGTADVWKTQSRGTGGQWWAPTRLDYFTLTLTYKNGRLTIYRNGLIDQQIDVAVSGQIAINHNIATVALWKVWDECLMQDEVKLVTAQSENLSVEQEFNNLSLPNEVYSDLVFPATLSNGDALTWTSTRTAYISNTGVFTTPLIDVPVDITVKWGTKSRTFNVVAKPRSISHNKIIAYHFNANDRYTKDGTDYIRDNSPARNDARIYGNVVLDGTLNLTANTLAGFATNGYLTVPQGLLAGLRSYTVLVTVKPTHLQALPRIFDFGSDTGNSVFGRLNALTAGFKYNGGTTTLINSPTQISSNVNTQLAFTYNAKTKETKIYINGTQAVSSTAIAQEPYQLALLSPDTRNYIARTQWQNSDNADYCGTIDDFFLYNTTLTATEIQAIQANPTNITIIDIMPETSVENIAHSNYTLYDLQGRKVSSKELQSGFYIAKSSTHTTRKLIIP